MQEVDLVVGEERHVSRDEPDLTHVEPILAVDPSDPDRLVAASIVFREGRMTSEVLVSGDGGESWTRRRFPRCGGDPWLAWGSAARVYFSCLGAADGPTPALVHRSETAGAEWSEAAGVPFAGGSSFDHTSLLAVPRPTEADLVYVAGMQGLRRDDGVLAVPFVARSEDGAESFEPPVRIVWSNVWANATNAVALDSARVGLAFVDFSVDGRRVLEHTRVWWARSDDRGRTFSFPHLVASARPRTLPVVSSGAARGTTAEAGGGERTTLYLAFDDARGEGAGIFLARSRDAGSTWSDPTRVVPCPEAEACQNPVTAVDPEGSLGLVWYERPPEAEAGCWRIRFTHSSDEGRSFLDPVTLSSREFCAVPRRTPRADRWPAGGDYFGLVATGPGAFRAVWADSRSGVYQLHTTTVARR